MVKSGLYAVPASINSSYKFSSIYFKNMSTVFSNSFQIIKMVTSKFFSNFIYKYYASVSGNSFKNKLSSCGVNSNVFQVFQKVEFPNF